MKNVEIKAVLLIVGAAHDSLSFRGQLKYDSGNDPLTRKEKKQRIRRKTFAYQG